MAALTLRLTKGTPLTNAEIDGNFTNLNNELALKLNTSQYTAADILTKLKTVDGTGSGLDADLIDGKAPTALNQVSTCVLRDASGNFAANIITANLVGNVTGTVSGNAGTVTNGVYTNGSYSNPVWITSLAGSKVTAIPNSSLTNSSVTINGVAISLGGSGSILNVTQTWTGVQTFRDSAFYITDNTDTTKRIAFEVSGITTGTTRTLTVPNATGTIALESYVDDIVTKTNTWTGSQTFRDGSFTVTDNSDTTKRLQLQLSGISTNTTRTLTVPNVNGTIAVLESPTFTGIPAAPTAAPGTSTTQLATTAFVTSALGTATGIGVNQTWQNLTASRAVGTAYRNTTGKPIMVTYGGRAPSYTSISFQVSDNGTNWVIAAIEYCDTNDDINGASLSVIVPNNHYYKAVGGTMVYPVWSELR